MVLDCDAHVEARFLVGRNKGLRVHRVSLVCKGYVSLSNDSRVERLLVNIVWQAGLAVRVIVHVVGARPAARRRCTCAVYFLAIRPLRHGSNRVFHYDSSLESVFRDRFLRSAQLLLTSLHLLSGDRCRQLVRNGVFLEHHLLLRLHLMILVIDRCQLLFIIEVLRCHPIISG